MQVALGLRGHQPSKMLQLWNESRGKYHVINGTFSAVHPRGMPRDYRLHPYHYSRSTHLLPGDCPIRMYVYKFLRHQHTADELILHNILWADVACCSCEGVCSAPTTITSSASAFGLESSGTLTWAPLLPDRLLDFLETVLPGLLEDVPTAVRQRLWFQHDGAPTHYEVNVWQWLSATYPGRWTGSRGPTAWPPW